MTAQDLPLPAAETAHHRPDQVRAMDLARIPLPTDLPCGSPARQWMARGFICPAAVPDCSPAASWNGACRSRWRRIPASKLWRSRASRRAPQATSSRCWPPARSGSAWLSVIAGNPPAGNRRQGRLERHRLRRAPLADHQAGGRPPAGPCRRLGGMRVGRPLPRLLQQPAPTRRLAEKYPIRPASTSRCPKRWRRNQGRHPLGERPEPVQTTRTTSR